MIRKAVKYTLLQVAWWANPGLLITIELRYREELGVLT